MELFRTAPWETEGPNGPPGSPTGPLGSPTSPDYRKHTSEDVSYSKYNVFDCIGHYRASPLKICLFCFLVLWKSLLKLIKWVSNEALNTIYISHNQRSSQTVIYCVLTGLIMESPTAVNMPKFATTL